MQSSLTQSLQMSDAPFKFFLVAGHCVFNLRLNVVISKNVINFVVRKVQPFRLHVGLMASLYQREGKISVDTSVNAGGGCFGALASLIATA